MAVPMIIGTDWWTDCDDCMAMRILASFHKKGKINILGVGLNACAEYSLQSLDGFLRAEGVDVPVGVDLQANDFTGKPPFQKAVYEVTESKYKSNSDSISSVSLYRKLLAESSEPVQIIEIGYLQTLSQLLLSGPDEYSQLTGAELVEQKVEKFWIMAGKWDLDGGLEHNFCNNPRAREAGHIFCKLCSKPVTFLGWEISHDIICGGGLDKNDPLYIAMNAHGSGNGRSSWDPMLCLLACIGDEEKAGFGLVRGRASVDSDTGANHFTKDEHGPHGYIIKLKDNEYYRKAVDEILLG
jgi:pyrimidine-specific ribonucleoside hydrolase